MRLAAHPILLCAVASLFLAGCAESETDDVQAAEPTGAQPTAPDPPQPVTYSGTTTHLGVSCDAPAQAFTEDHGGWWYQMESAGTMTGDPGWVAWEREDGERVHAEHHAEGRVPSDAVAVTVCLGLSSQGMTMEWSVTLSPA